MSNESSRNRIKITPPQVVILKGFSDEPLKLLAVFDRGDSIEVAREVADEPMPFHSADVFKFDADVYAELEQAASRMDRSQLNKAWAMARPFRRSA